MYRVYDKKRKIFMPEDVFMSKNGDLYMVDKKLWGNKLTFLHQGRYIFQKAIGLNDKHDSPIYIGDYIRAKIAEDRSVIGLVTFAKELSSYVILCDDTDEYFTLGQSVCDLIEIIGNVFEEPKEVKKDGQQSL